jgi:hypothetical protein
MWFMYKEKDRDFFLFVGAVIDKVLYHKEDAIRRSSSG